MLPTYHSIQYVHNYHYKVPISVWHYSAYIFIRSSLDLKIATVCNLLPSSLLGWLWGRDWSCGKWLFKVWTCRYIRCTVSHQRQPSNGRAEGDVGLRAAAPMIRLCNILQSNSLLRLARGYLVASSTIFLLLEYHLQLEIALYYNAILNIKIWRHNCHQIHSHTTMKT